LNSALLTAGQYTTENTTVAKGFEDLLPRHVLTLQPMKRHNLYLIADNLASHSSRPIREWLAVHPRIRHAFIPVGAAWLNLIEVWWRLFRRKAFAGQSLADDRDIAYVTRTATAQLNRRAKPWVWGRPPRTHRSLRRRFVYCL
jgi:hypothetical protein